MFDKFKIQDEIRSLNKSNINIVTLLENVILI